MSAPDAARVGVDPVRPAVRWSVPAALLLIEYAILSVLVDFPTSGPALGIASAGRMLVPAALGALSAGWLISRRGIRAALRDLAGPLPPWRPWPFAVLQVGAFAATATVARLVLGPAAAPPSIGGLLVVLACAAVCAVLALATAAPVAWLARLAWLHVGAQVAALGMGLLAWRAAVLAEGLWGVLRGSTVYAVGALLRGVRPEAIVLPDQSVVGLPGFAVAIAPVCSGVDGLGLVLVFQALWLSLARDRLRLGRAFLLVPLGAAAALGTNVIRIAALVALGASGHADLAMGAFHSKLGWILFLGIAFATVLIAEQVPWFRRVDDAPAATDEGVPRLAAAYVGPLFVSVAVALLTSLWARPDLDPWYGARGVAAALVLIAARKDLPRLALPLSWTPVLIGAAVGTAWIAWPSAHGTELPTTLAQLPAPARDAWIAARLAASCLVLPLVEELAFRGFLLPWLVAPEFESVPPRAWTWPAVVLSSLAFGAVHDRLLLGTIAGAAFALARLWRGRLSDAVLAHALSNAIVAAAALGFGRWNLWS